MGIPKIHIHKHMLSIAYILETCVARKHDGKRGINMRTESISTHEHCCSATQHAQSGVTYHITTHKHTRITCTNTITPSPTNTDIQSHNTAKPMSVKQHAQTLQLNHHTLHTRTSHRQQAQQVACVQEPFSRLGKKFYEQPVNLWVCVYVCMYVCMCIYTYI